MSPDHPQESVPVEQALFMAHGAAAATRLSATDTVRARILLSIEHGLLVKGSKLPKTESIAKGLDVSTITARRALESLVEDGVLLRKRGRGGGTFVAEALTHTSDTSVQAFRADAQAIHTLIDQRSLMEQSVMAAAAQLATEQECERLEQLIQASHDAESWLEHHEPDVEFHTLCATISKVPELETYLSCYHALIKYYVIYPQTELEAGRDDHRGLVQAFRERDSIAAMRITRSHVDALRREMFVALPRTH